MPFALPAKHKFGCVCLVNAAVDRALRDQQFVLGNGLVVVFGPPFEMEEHWRQWLGSVKSEDIARTSVTLLAHSMSDQPDILDNENQHLMRLSSGLFYGLLMLQVFHHDRVISLSGANTGDRVSVRQVSDLNPHIRPNGVHVRALSRGTFPRAAAIAVALQTIHSPVPRYERLRNGFRAWHRGVQEHFGADRLHQFVRAVEAIVKPEIGRSERLFVHRCQIMAGSSDATRELLHELYQLRSQAEHMNPFEAVLQDYDPARRDQIAIQRAYQSQVLANNVYERILATPALHAVFDSDDHIDDFWSLPMNEQQRIWGRPVDLDALARANMENPFA